MAMSTLRRLLIVLTLATVSYLLLGTGLITLKSPPPSLSPRQTPAGVPAGTPAALPEVAPAGDAADDGQRPAAAIAPHKERMRMADAPNAFTPAQPAIGDYSYSLSKESNERAILPGVTLVPGQGVSIKTANKDETVHIKRDSAYQTTDYQVLWQKKY